MSSQLPTIVVIDDRREFCPAITDRAVTYFCDCQSALDGLTVIHNQQYSQAAEPIGELWLDHDLADGRDIGPVIRLLAEWHSIQQPLMVTTICVHTANAAKAMSMVQELRNLGYVTLRVEAAANGLIDNKPW